MLHSQANLAWEAHDCIYGCLYTCSKAVPTHCNYSKSELDNYCTPVDSLILYISVLTLKNGSEGLLIKAPQMNFS